MNNPAPGFKTRPEHRIETKPAGRRVQVTYKGELIGDTYWSHVARRPLTIFFRHFFRFFVPFLGWKALKRSMRKLYWLFHHYKVAAIVGRKTA